MTTDISVYGLGDVTKWFKERAQSSLIICALKHARIECVVARCTQEDSTLDGFVGSQKDSAKTYRVTWKGHTTTLMTYAIPRDVWHVLRGIGLAL